MRRNRISVLVILTLLMIPGYLFSDTASQGENNSVTFADQLSSEILQNPASTQTPDIAYKLAELAPVSGRRKVLNTFNEAVKKLESGELSISLPFLKLLIDELEGRNTESVKNFSIIKKWNISGPWKRYGKPDADFMFQPEKILKIKDIEKSRNITSEENGGIYPFQLNHYGDETVYLTNSFTCSAGIILWLECNTDYKLFINGKEVSSNRILGKKIYSAFRLTGARGYTVQVKLRSGKENHHPYFRGMITDQNHLPVALNPAGTIFSYSYTSETLYSTETRRDTVPCDASILTEKMENFIGKGNYYNAYKLGVLITEKFPAYLPAYKVFFPLLDIMNKDEEFIEYLKRFNGQFPESDIHISWACDYYMTRDRDKFTNIMSGNPLSYMSVKSIESYLYLLCGEKKYNEALKVCSAMLPDPRFRHVVPEIIKLSGDSDLWRKKLIEEASDNEDPYFYYLLGLAEMQTGLDPVMYWRKGYSLHENSGLMRDISDIYENGIFGLNEYYSGIYTDLHPEFGWAAKKRKISIHVYESGKIFIEGEDIIPPGNRIRNQKYSLDGIEYLSGEISTTVPWFEGIKILYVLTAKDGLPSPADFSSGLTGKNTLNVRIKTGGDEEFSVIKYSGEYRNKTDNFTLLKELIIKSKNEKISGIEYEVVCHGNFAPLAKYKTGTPTAGKHSDGITKFEISEKISEDDMESIASEIMKFSSDRVFADWYGGVVKHACRPFTVKNLDVSKTESTEGKIRKVQHHLMSSISKKGEIDFNPSNAETVYNRGEGTVEERTLLAKTILEDVGVKTYISFKKNKAGLIDKILLYIPENRNRGYWLDLYGDGVLEKKDPGSDAIVITGEGFETFPVNPETYIR